MNAYEEDQVLSVLPFLDPDFLREIWILDSEFWLGVNKILKIDMLVELDQWKSASQIVIRRCIPAAAIPYFCHTTVAFISLFSIDLEELALLEKTFLDSTSLQKLRFEYANFPDQQLFLEILGVPLQTGTERNWFIKIPESDQILHILQNPVYKNISFIRENLSDVPEKAHILE